MKNVWVALCQLIAIPIALLLFGEFAVRVWQGRLLSRESPHQAMIAELMPHRPETVDPILGWLPRPGFSRGGKSPVSIDCEGYRCNGSADASSVPALVAVGDSFTWGTGVRDAETWPAHLETQLGTQVRNAGVGGYGFDQIVLRGQAILARQRVDWLLVSFTHEDIPRCEYAFRFARWKPYFTIGPKGLVFHRATVGTPAPATNSLLLNAIDHSYCIHAVMNRLAGELWHGVYLYEPRVHNDGCKVASLLLRRLSADAAQTGAQILLIAQADPNTNTETTSKVIAPLLATASQLRMPVLDLTIAMGKAIQAQPILRQQWTGPDGAHLSSTGNHWVATKIGMRLRALGVTVSPSRFNFTPPSAAMAR